MILVLLISACSTSKLVLHSLSFELSKERHSTPLIWSRKLSGPVTDMALSPDRSFIAVVTIGESEENGSLITVLNWNNDVVWQTGLHTKVKDLIIAEKAAYVIASTYDEEIVQFGAKGEMLWSHSQNGTCQLIALPRTGDILCYYDDEPVPGGLVFDVLNGAGQKLKSFSISGDALTLKVSDDGQNIASWRRSLMIIYGENRILFGSRQKIKPLL